MPLLRFLDPDGEERDIADINHLFELIQAGWVSYESLIHDDNAGRWVPARDHEFFVRIRNLARQNSAANPLPEKRPSWYNSKKIEIKQKVDNKSRELFLAVGPGHRFLIMSICAYILGVIFCLSAILLGHGAGRRPFVILLATPILLPIGLRVAIPTMLIVWARIGSRIVPVSSMKQAMARNSGFIVGGVLLTSIIFSAAVALSD